MLVSEGAHVNQINCRGENVLHFGCYNDAVVKLFIAAGANVNQIEKCGRNPLFNVCNSDAPSVAVVKSLIAAGADVHQCNDNGYNRLLNLCINNHSCDISNKVEIARELNAARANLNHVHVISITIVAVL